MKCSEIKEKLLTKKANMDEEQILKEVMLDFTKDRIDDLLSKGYTDEDIQKALKDSIASVLRRRKTDYMNSIQ